MDARPINMLPVPTRRHHHRGLLLLAQQLVAQPAENRVRGLFRRGGERKPLQRSGAFTSLLLIVSNT